MGFVGLCARWDCSQGQNLQSPDRRHKEPSFQAQDSGWDKRTGGHSHEWPMRSHSESAQAASPKATQKQERRFSFEWPCVDLNVTHGGSPELSNSKKNFKQGTHSPRLALPLKCQVSGNWQHRMTGELAGKASLLWASSHLARFWVIREIAITPLPTPPYTQHSHILTHCTPKLLHSYSMSEMWRISFLQFNGSQLEVHMRITYGAHSAGPYSRSTELE